MSAFSDLIHGNFGNIGHDLSADPWGTAAGVGAALATAAIPFTFGGSAPLAAELGGVALGGEAAGAGLGLFGGAEAAGGLGALGFGGAEAGLGAGLGAEASGMASLDSLLGLGGAAGTEGLGSAGTLAAAAPEAAVGAGGTFGIGDAAAGAWGGAGGDAAGSLGGFGSTATEGVLAPAGATAPVAGAGASGGTDILGTIGSSIAKNPMQAVGALAAGGGLAYNFMQGQQTPQNVQAIQDQARQLGASGATLQNYLTSGTLPPAMQASMDAAKAAARARIISQHASRGLPTDPNMNSALAQELNNVDLQAVAAVADVQTKLFNTGVQEVGMSANLYQWLQGRDDKQAQNMGAAIANFAGALAGMGSRNNVTINVPRQAAA